MNTVKIICSNLNCQKEFDKPVNEYNRRIKLNSPIYCSRKCAGIQNLKNFGDKINRIPPTNRIKSNPFKYYLRNSSKRNKECNLDLGYLQNLWNTQKGICPYSGISLTLNNHSKRSKNRISIASIDRIDSSKGYIKGNIQFVALPINYLKGELTHEQTIEVLKTISNFYKP